MLIAHALLSSYLSLQALGRASLTSGAIAQAQRDASARLNRTATPKVHKNGNSSQVHVVVSVSSSLQQHPPCAIHVRVSVAAWFSRSQALVEGALEA